jgi:hypothetical protein
MNENVWKVWSEVEEDKTLGKGLIYTNYLQQPPEEVMKDILDLIPPLVLELPVAEEMFHAFQVMTRQKCNIVRLKEMELGKLFAIELCDAFMSVDGKEMYFSSELGSVIIPENGIVVLPWKRNGWSFLGYIFAVHDKKYYKKVVVPIVLDDGIRTTLYEWYDKGQIGKLVVSNHGEFTVSV